MKIRTQYTMKLIGIFAMCYATTTFADTYLDEYKGKIGNSPIQMTLLYNDRFEDIDTSAVYAYTKYDTPLFLTGKVENGNLILTELDEKWQPTATITFANFDKNKYLIEQSGTWQSLTNGKSYPVQLEHTFDYNHLHKYSAKPILVADSNKRHYFKLVSGDNLQIEIVRVYEKGTDKIIQDIPYDWHFNLHAISTDDYNFDGYDDFAYLTGSSMGNTFSKYFLWNPKTKQYEESNIAGSSLTFDQKKKRIYLENRSGAGRYATYITYKLDSKNEMVQLSKKCTELNVDSANNEDYYEVEIECHD